MKTVKLICGAALLTLAASCAQDEMELNTISTSNTIAYKVEAGKMSRSYSSFENGTDIKEMKVSAWLREPGVNSPKYNNPESGNTTYFLNDLMARIDGSGTFNYSSDARYWPANGESLDFYAVVSNEAFGEAGEFGFNLQNGLPGLAGYITQKSIAEMPDMLFSTAFDQKKSTTTQKQQNVSLRFDHAFAKVEITAQVKNNNLRLEIYDVAIGGVANEGQFTFPYIDENGEEQKADWSTWTTREATSTEPDLENKENVEVIEPSTRSSEDEEGDVEEGNQTPEPGKLQYRYYPTKIEKLMTVYDTDDNGNSLKKVVLDMKETAKKTLVGNGEGVNKDMLVIPHKYQGRNAEGKIKTYIRLKIKAYNIADKDAGFDDDTDNLIFPKLAEGKTDMEPDYIYIPIDFNWAMGTVNKYNLVFDCGNGGSQTDPDDDPDPVDPDDPDSTDPDDPTPGEPDPDEEPAFILVGFDVTVEDWVDGEDFSTEYPGGKIEEPATGGNEDPENPEDPEDNTEENNGEE